MSDTKGKKDLIVLAADKHIRSTLRGIMDHPKKLDIRRVSCDIRLSPGNDSGCRQRAADTLRHFHNQYRYALVVFDHQGCGTEKQSREDIQTEVRDQLERNGWQGARAQVIVIEPELEAWVWSKSPRVPEILGWKGGYKTLKGWLEDEGCWQQNAVKPHDPKRAMRRVIKKSGNAKRSPSIYTKLAAEVSFRNCEDPAFNELKETLKRWFSKTSSWAGAPFPAGRNLCA